MENDAWGRGGEVGLYTRPESRPPWPPAGNSARSHTTACQTPVLEALLPYELGPLAQGGRLGNGQATLGKIKEGRSYRPPSIHVPASIARSDRSVVALTP